mmetsp:Transcript_28122/g.62738  ORF Transcript_28122/g.62738 Transcript_28122/m.62738 type:complete len:343 (-) Transcript_28122:347-1375(-)
MATTSKKLILLLLLTFSSSDPVTGLNFPGEVNLGDELEAEAGEGLDLGLHLELDHELELLDPLGVLGDEVFLEQVLGGLQVALAHRQEALLRQTVPVKVAGPEPEPLHVRGGEGVRVVAHVLGPAAVHAQDLEPVRVRVHKGQHRDIQRGFQFPEEHAGGHVGLPLARDDDALVRVVETVFRQTHEDGVLLHQKDKVGVGLNVGDLVHEGRDPLAAHSDPSAVDGVPGLEVAQPPHHQALLRRHHVEARPGAPHHAGDVVEHGVGLVLLGEELHVRVEHVALRHVNALAQYLVDELHDTRGDGHLPHVVHVHEAPLAPGVLENDSVQLLHVHLVARRPGRHR